MYKSRQALSSELATHWAQMAHAFYLEALVSQSDWDATDLAFHGGTSLRLSWSSARYSEDLDFLLSSSVRNFDAVMRRVDQRLIELFRQVDPNFSIRSRDRTRDADRMPAFMISVSHPGYVGTARIKAEFWRTTPAYLEKYPTQLRTPQIPAGDDSRPAPDLVLLASNPVPAATLDAAYAYNPVGGLAPDRALAQFLERPAEDIVRHADPDLKNWLPPRLWQRLQGNGVQQMVDYVRGSIAAVSAHLSGESPQDVDLKSVDWRAMPGQ